MSKDKWTAIGNISSTQGIDPQFVPSARLTIATAAMQAILASPLDIKITDEVKGKNPQNVAIAAVAYADALLDELSKTKG